MNPFLYEPIELRLPWGSPIPAGWELATDRDHYWILGTQKATWGECWREAWS